MFRLVFLSFLGVMLLRPALADESPRTDVVKAVPIPSPTPPAPPIPVIVVAPVLSPSAKPGSAIAESVVANSKRDAPRDHSSAPRPLLQATAPTLGKKVVAPVEATPAVKVAVSLSIGSLFPPAPREVTGPEAFPAPASAPRILAPAIARPHDLASRAALQNRARLVQLDADLGAEEPRLNRSQASLARSQRQLGVFTSVLRSAMADAGDDGSGLHPFVRVAQRYLGTPYVWGGESARGFDCSGFIMRVMRDLGYRALPHSAAEQFRYGTPIARGSLKPGDVVFFANTYKPGVSHVGIYLGRGRFIHAANSHVGTIISSLNEPKWVEHYAGARRLVAKS